LQFVNVNGGPGQVSRGRFYCDEKHSFRMYAYTESVLLFGERAQMSNAWYHTVIAVFVVIMGTQ